MKPKLTMMVAAAMACAAIQLAAMPTEEETRKAEPVVKKMLAQERAALESGKKTRSEVAVAAIKLADETDTDAAKLLLMKGAFVLYVRDGKLEKAVETMKALKATIPDIPPQSVTNIIEAALLEVSKKEDGAPLYKLLDESKADIASIGALSMVVKERNSIASILKGMIKVPGSDLWLSETELTQGQWEAVMGNNPSLHKGVNLPVENISRDECDIFLEKLNQTKEVQASQFEFCLPGRAEWAGAARAGNPDLIPWIKPGVAGELLDMAWLKENSDGETHAVATKVPNAFGFYDMVGNVHEWVIEAPETLGTKRGYSFANPLSYCRPGRFSRHERNKRFADTGLRLAAHVRPQPALMTSGATGKTEVTAQTLQSCDFLLNKDFKKNAKYYLCLFSASWYGPCRAEMPRIAKTYAESLKDDPNIELIHFSMDQNDEKALAWAKEHDVKFPVVKPNGGNPLDLHTYGIPHLFIVKADGTLVEEGHPMKLFTDEKLRELKVANCSEGATGKTKMLLSGKEIIDGVEWTYSIKDGKAQVDYASSSNVTGVISIPSTLGGHPVTSIRGRQYGQPGVFGKCSKLTSVTIPSSVTSIGERAFESCRELRTVTIQSNATSIGSFAFFGCDSLVSFVIPSGVTSIGCRAFCHCRGLTSVTIPASVKRIEREAFMSCDKLMSISVEPDNPSYSSRNGLLCSKDGSILVAGVNGDVTIPSSVTRIGDGAFDGYGGLTGVTIPSSVTRIGKRAFAICRRLTSVKIPSSVTSIGGDAFNGTPFYNNMPDGMVVLGGGVLCEYKGKCPSAVVIPSNVRSIADSAFSEGGLRGLIMRRRGAGLGLKMLEISSSVTNIGNCAFSYCGDLTNVTMRGERPDAPNNIFERCGKLKSIHVPANAKSWAGMKEWQGIPLVFDGEDAGRQAQAEHGAERQAAESAQRQAAAERKEQLRQLEQIQEELRRQREAKQAEK